MTCKHDIVLKNGRVIDPVNGRNGVMDVAVSDRKIAEVAETIDPGCARDCFDVRDKIVIPGIIDLHVHASGWLGGRFAHKMLAQAGVTTALDMSGPIDGVLEKARDYGAGLNLACIQYIRPGHTVTGTDPGKDELAELLRKSLKAGAIGFKIIGGHYPLTPEATARIIEITARNGAYVAFHAGTLAEDSGSNLNGLKEAADLAQGNPLHLAHVNSYCRGLIKSPILETEAAIDILEASPNICSESYLSPINGTSAEFIDGKPESRITGTWLKQGGYPPTEEGMAAAILAGWAQINVEAGGTVILATGKEALEFWRAHKTVTTVSFDVNPPESRFRLAAAKRGSGEFAVDCIGTDGGGIPRNVILSMGLSLIKFRGISLEEFVIKTSRNPAKILGLTNKGHLGPGADADITVADFEKQKPVMAISNGRIIMYNGLVCGWGGRFITTPAGEESVRNSGLEPLVVDPAETPFLRRTFDVSNHLNPCI